MILNLGYQWAIARAVDVEGVVYLASGGTNERFVRNSESDYNVVLFDPQLYLAGLNAVDHSIACGRLSTYSWFGVDDSPQFDSAIQSRREWENAAKEHATANWIGSAPKNGIVDVAGDALELQQQLGCTHVLSPTPLITDREDDGEEFSIWLDAGIVAADQVDLAGPLLATIAVDEVCLSERVFEPAGFLDTIVDQVTSRQEFDGVYFVVAQTAARHPFASAENVLRTYAHLTKRFADHGYPFVMPNFCDMFGFVCAGLGASQILNGATQSLRRLCFASPSMGRALPSLYSHRTVSEYRTETDLNRVRDSRSIRHMQDITPVSRPLFQRLKAGGSAADLPAWAESINNVDASRRHFIDRVRREWYEIADMDRDTRYEAIFNWLDDADAADLVVRERVGQALSGQSAPKQLWMRIMEETSGI